MRALKLSKPKLAFLTSLFVGALLMHFMAACTFEPPQDSRAAQAKKGLAIYKEQCASCHGGKGMVATVDTLSTPAPDLTRILASRGKKSGDFPVGEIARVIDGRMEVAAHGPRTMPVWGEVYESEGMDDNEIKGRKGELIAYLMSIQTFD
jgi:mono/diheme cytochrome c family protein